MLKNWIPICILCIGNVMASDWNPSLESLIRGAATARDVEPFIGNQLEDAPPEGVSPMELSVAAAYLECFDSGAKPFTAGLEASNPDLLSAIRAISLNESLEPDQVLLQLKGLADLHFSKLVKDTSARHAAEEVGLAIESKERG